MRKDIREAIYMAKIEGDKINFEAIARQYNCEYRTVKRYYNQRDGTQDKRKSGIVRKKLDGYQEIIPQKFIEDRSP